MSFSDFFADENDWQGVHIALAALRKDFQSVFVRAPGISVVAGTLGKSRLIDEAATKINASFLAGKRESYILQETVENGRRTLFIAGSDKRGTIYGIYRISEMIGVSPWAWWADSVPEKRGEWELETGFRHEQGEPSVKYRGFFLNDEAPSLTGWVGKNFGRLANPKASPGYDSEFYAKVFELLLRLKGNYFWPVMWNNSFHTDDPKNTALAHEMGIVMGTSHHEHMTCADKEWTWAGRGDWNYHTNRERIYEFWKEGAGARREYESIVTLGMRGQADTAILGKNASLSDNIALLQSVIDDQRGILRGIHGEESAVPQMLALYKEVEDFFYGDKNARLEVPDDVTLMLCDDNFGNLRTLPTPEMLSRKGGFGMYYHLDYRGEPVSYQWINQVPLAKIWDNMTTAYDAGIRDIWIVNVGDLKPMELPLEYFLELAYDFEKWCVPNKTGEFTWKWAAREFGAGLAEDIAAVLSGYTKILGARKAEVVSPETFSVSNFNEAGRVFAEFEKIVAIAEKISEKIPPEKEAAFFQLVLYPARAAFNVYAANIYAAKNDAARAKAAFEANAADTEFFNKLCGGKWDGIMRQNHMGYTAWDSAKITPVANAMPKIVPTDHHPAASRHPSEEGNCYAVINPSDFAKNIPAGGAEFVVIKNYGRDGDSVKILPNGAEFLPNSDAPALEYRFLLNAAENFTANIFLAPTNPPRNSAITPNSQQLRFSVQIDDGARKTVSGVPERNFTPGVSRSWGMGVMDNARIVEVPCGRLDAGEHRLRIFGVDPRVVIQKIVIAPAAERPKIIANAPLTTHFMGSFFGPPV